MAKPAYRAGRDQAATSENVELLTGQRGDKLDKAVTFRELNALGLATLRPGAGGIYVPGKNPDLFPTGVYDKPHAPVNVQASGAFHTVLVDWDGPTYRGHAHTEVWRAETDSLPAATLVGTTIANMFSDAIGKGAKFYYWVRFVNGKDDHGPFHGEHGVVAETSRDVQDILDELQGKIESSHLAQELLKPILDVPQLSAIIDETKANLAALDVREKQINDLLNHAQGALGDNYINVTLIQEQLRQLINGYQTDFEDFRDAVFAVDPSTGEITMEAVNAVRSELGAEITKVSQHLDAVEAIVKTCVTRAEISADLEKITSIEQQIDGINGKLTQTATKSEVTAVGSQVTQVSQELDVVKGSLTQKAAKTEVDAQGQRLTVAEQQISANTTANSATAERIEQLKSEMQSADQTIKSSITELAQSVASDTQALAQKMSAMEVAMDGNTAAISELQQAISGDGQSLASKFENMSASVDLAGDAAIGATLAGADESDRQRKATGKIRREQKVLSDQQQAMASTLEQLEADFQAESADLRGQIINEQTVRATETGALAQRVGTVEAEFKAADSALGASISEVAKASADADGALANQIQQVTAEFKKGDATISGQITSESEARANADGALGKRIDTVTAKTGELESAVQTQSKAIADLENGAEAMWTTKVQAGDITAGIGLVAKDDGTSQVALSASQVFVFDPNSSTPLAPLFAIDNGQTVIAEAIIRKATIQIIQSEKITADYIKAGVSITTPLINGGQIDMGNAFMAGGAAGFGKGGPYGGWGWGWHSIIYSDGSIYTNKLNAEGGYVRNMTIGNCTIDYDCVVKGTIYAERIVGDVAAIKSLNQNISGPTDVTFSVPAISNMDRDIVVSGINVQVSGYTTGGGGDHGDKDYTVSVDVSFFLNGYHQSTFSASATGQYRKDSCHPSFHFRLPRGQPAIVVIRFSGGGGYINVNMSGAIAMVTKVGSATFG
ncbi:phage tail tip fiber protein [Aeromonas veronii]|uniref:phage tail tip fiber protein n=1 Tax=Aeromonas veronii TaxID=654 RepID=UPI003D1BE088